MMKPRMMIAAAAAAALVLAACGDDDDSASEATTAAPATTQAPATTAAPTTTEAPATTTASTEEPATTESASTADAASTGDATGTAAADDPYCALVEEMFNQESPPTAEQLQQYQEIAPAEVQDAITVAAPPLIAAGENVVDFFAAYAQDDVEQSVEEIDAFENETCGVEHEDRTPPEGASREIEDSATHVDVVATDYAFDIPAVEAGRNSFVLTNQGHEAHFLLIVKLAEGATLDEALQSEDDSMIEGFWETGLAAPDGEDDEAITFDVEPGNYGAVCFVPRPDGTPHAFMGMQKEFTVS
jgi:hypothetical protein